MTTANFTQRLTQRAASFTALASIFAAAVLMTSVPAQAQTKDQSQVPIAASATDNSQATRPLTRAEVRAEFIRARAAGELPVDGFSGYFFEQPQARQVRVNASDVRASK